MRHCGDWRFSAVRTTFCYCCCYLLCRVHPGPQGHKVLAELLAAGLDRALEEAAAGYTPTARPLDSEVPPPMAPNFRPTLALYCASQVRVHVWHVFVFEDFDCTTNCVLQKNFKNLVKASSGFSYGPQRPNATSWQAQKWGWSSNQLGACASHVRPHGCAPLASRASLPACRLDGLVQLVKSESGMPQTLPSLHAYRCLG